jgi:four helix bundle protein
MPIRSYRDLMVWRKAMDLAETIYQFARALPRNEIYGLGSQMQRAAVSVPSNIAEDQARRHTAEFRQSLIQALGSLAELDTQPLPLRLTGLPRAQRDIRWRNARRGASTHDPRPDFPPSERSPIFAVHQSLTTNH